MTRSAGVMVTEFVAECLWPGVRQSDLPAVDERASASAEQLSTERAPVRYLGSLLMPEDEVVLCLFSGELNTVRRVATEAQIPFERILEAERSPWGVTAMSKRAAGEISK